MKSLDRIENFLEVVKNQSFAKAARILGLTGPAVSKQVMALEEDLGVKLLHRTTRQVTLTEEGGLYYDRVRLAVEELKDAAAEIQDRKSSPRGLLRVNAPASFGKMHLLPVFSGFAKKYPDVTLEVIFEDRMIDVMADGYDIVIRIGTPPDSSLVCRTLAAAPSVVVASPAYLQAHGTPETPADLKRHRMIAYTYHGGSSEWKYQDKRGHAGSFRAPGIFRANNAEMMREAALDGVGIAVLPLFSVKTYIDAGRLTPLLTDYTTAPQRAILALMPPNRHRAAKVQLFLDWLAQSCKAMPI